MIPAVVGEELRDLDLANGSGWIRIEKAAFEALLDHRPVAGPLLSIVDAHIETITAIFNHKRAIRDVEQIDGKRMIRITAADVEAA